MRDSGDESFGARGDRLVIARREHFARHELRADADGRRTGADEIRDVVQVHAPGRVGMRGRSGKGPRSARM